MDSLSLGPVPAEESCQQVGTPSYSEAKARKECQRYIGLLRKTFGDEPDGARLRITSNPHDFGSYLDVQIFFNPTDEKAVDYAYRLEKDAPPTWEG